MARRRREPAPDLSTSVEREVEQLSSLTGDLGDRLAMALASLKEASEVPSGDWVRAYRAYEQSVATLLAERRKNAALLAGVPEAPLPDEEYQATLDELVERRISEMDSERLGRLMLNKLNQETSKT